MGLKNFSIWQTELFLRLYSHGITKGWHNYGFQLGVPIRIISLGRPTKLPGLSLVHLASYHIFRIPKELVPFFQIFPQLGRVTNFWGKLLFLNFLLPLLFGVGNQRFSTPEVWEGTGRVFTLWVTFREHFLGTFPKPKRGLGIRGRHLGPPKELKKASQIP